MSESVSTISVQELSRLVGTPTCPLIFDVRRESVFSEAEDILPTARWRDHRRAFQWGADLKADTEVVVYCVHGHQVSQSAAAALRSLGVCARYLDGGIEAYRDFGAPLINHESFPVSLSKASHWVTGQRPKMAETASAWFIRRFFDRDAVFHLVAHEWVTAVAEEIGATAIGIHEATRARLEGQQDLDGVLMHFAARNEELMQFASIARGADTRSADAPPQAAGLQALLLGFSAIESEDRALLERGIALCDALYGWCRYVADEGIGSSPPSAFVIGADG